jgi:hypothetical protein
MELQRRRRAKFATGEESVTAAGIGSKDWN